MKRRLYLVTALIFIIVIAMSGCTDIYETIEAAFGGSGGDSTKIVVKKSEPIKELDTNGELQLSPYYEPVKLKNGYNNLQNDEEKRCYKAIAEHVTDFTDKRYNDLYLMKEFTVDCSINPAQLDKVFTAFMEDNPQLFWLEEVYSYSTGEQVKMSLIGIMSERQYRKCIKKFNNKVSSILNSLKEDMTELQREIYIHDCIIDNCKYKDKESASMRYCAYGALVDGKAVCSGYTKAFQYLLSLVGINSQGINGRSQKQEHMWSAVELSDGWYYTDITWDDSHQSTRYDYFNITEGQLNKNHKFHKEFKDCSYDEIIGTDNTKPINYNFTLPNCDNIENNYYYAYGSHYEDENNNTLAEDLAKVIDEGDSYFYIYTPDVKSAYNELFDKNTYVFANYIDKANVISSQNNITGHTWTYKKKYLNTIAVELEYK